MAIATCEQLIAAIRASKLLDQSQLTRAVEVTEGLADLTVVARKLVTERLLTRWQASQVLSGGPLLYGKYRLLDQTGYTDHGPIYLGEDIQTRQQVTLYTLEQNGEIPPQRVQTLVGQAKRIAALDHPNLARLHNLVSDGSACLLACEHVEGEDLRRITEHRRSITTR